MSIAENFEVIADAVYKKGKKDEYDAFWDTFQSKGTRVNYQNGFSGSGWNNTTFRPKYDIKPTNNASSMFQQTKVKDLTNLLKNCGVTLDTSKATSLLSLFYFATDITNIPVIDATGTTASSALTTAFNNCSKLKTIEKLILKDDGSQSFDNTFGVCSALENIVIEGKIGQNGFKVSGSTKLTKNSLLEILKALSLDITTTKTITFSTAHQTVIETDEDCKPYWQAAKDAGWSFVYA